MAASAATAATDPMPSNIMCLTTDPNCVLTAVHVFSSKAHADPEFPMNLGTWCNKRGVAGGMLTLKSASFAIMVNGFACDNDFFEVFNSSWAIASELKDQRNVTVAAALDKLLTAKLTLDRGCPGGKRTALTGFVSAAVASKFPERLKKLKAAGIYLPILQPATPHKVI